MIVHYCQSLNPDPDSGLESVLGCVAVSVLLFLSLIYLERVGIRMLACHHRDAMLQGVPRCLKRKNAKKTEEEEGGKEVSKKVTS